MRYVIAVMAGVLLALPAAASADTRTGSIQDPQDGVLHQNVDGTSYREPDIQTMAVSYDSAAGTFTASVTYFEPLPEANGSNVLEIGLGTKFSDYSNIEDSCSDLADGATMYLMAQRTVPTWGRQDYLKIAGYEGTLPVSRSLSDDGRTLSATVTAGTLVNKPWLCVGGPLGQSRTGYSYESFHCTSYGCYDYRYSQQESVAGFPLLGPGGYTAPQSTNTGTVTPVTPNPKAPNPSVSSPSKTVSAETGAEDETVTLSRTQAKREAFKALSRKYGSKWKRRNYTVLKCSRTARLRFTCNGAFHYGSYRRTATRKWRIGNVFVIRKGDGSYGSKVRMRADHVIA